LEIHEALLRWGLNDVEDGLVVWSKNQRYQHVLDA
jgi:hypothetical protein